MKHFSLFVLVSIFTLTAFAQTEDTSAQTTNRRHIEMKPDTLSEFLQKYMYLKLDLTKHPPKMDTISYLYNKYLGQLDYLNDPSVPARYIPPHPDLLRLFVPSTYYYSPYGRLSKIKWKFPKPFTTTDLSDELLPYDKNQFTGIRRSGELVDKALLDYYIKRPDKILTTEGYIMSLDVFREDIKPQISPKARVINLFQAEEMKSHVRGVKTKIRRPNWWETGGDFWIQMTQNHISENWYKGGESNFSGSSGFRLRANYNDRNKIKFNNQVEIRFGMASTPSDKFHDYLINEDLFKFNTSLDLQAIRNWYYTISGEFKTQFFNGYYGNNEELISSFLSPAYTQANIGMKYSLNKKNFNLNVELGPLAYGLTFVDNDKVNQTRFGVEKGKYSKSNFGSSMKTTFNWTVFRFLRIDSRLEYFSNYKMVRMEWESNFNFTLNRYLSTTINVFNRFDDTNKPAEGQSYFQFKEFLKFGINYSW